MKKILLLVIALFIGAAGLYAQNATLLKAISDLEKEIANDLSFPPAESDAELNKGSYIEVLPTFNGIKKLTGSNPKGTHIFVFELRYLPVAGRDIVEKEIWEIDVRQNLTITYADGALKFNCPSIPAVCTKINATGTKTSTASVAIIKDVSKNKRYSGMASIMQAKFTALKLHLDRNFR